jgi:hypothetical protein
MIVKHIKHREGWTGRVLIMGKEYSVIEVIEQPYEVEVRLKDEQGTPGIFPLALFEVIDNSIPPDWKIEFFGKNDFRLSPTAFKTKNELWEDYFEGDSETKAKAIQIVEEEIEKIDSFHKKSD